MESENLPFPQDKKHKCHIDGCNVSFKKKCFLEIHLRKHNNERPFCCTYPDCQKSYRNSWHLKRHKSLVHDKAEEIICDVKGCGMVLSGKCNLIRHKNRSHKDSNYSYTCSICSQTFNKKRQLNQHIHSHSGVSQFSCAICNITFDKLHLYNKHKRNHKKFTCDCGEVFNRWTIFCEHRRNSCRFKKIDHKCAICDKIFTTKENLKQHSLKIHVEESQNDVYRCPYMNCKRSYKYKKNLTAHIASFHEKLKEGIEVKCTEPGCEVIFKNEIYLRRHVKHIHCESKPKVRKPRKPRKDKGKPKKAMASILSGVKLSNEDNLIMLNEGYVPAQKKLEQTDVDCTNNVGENETYHHENELRSVTLPEFQESIDDFSEANDSDDNLHEGNLINVNEGSTPAEKKMEQTVNCTNNVVEELKNGNNLSVTVPEFQENIDNFSNDNLHEDNLIIVNEDFTPAQRNSEQSVNCTNNVVEEEPDHYRNDLSVTVPEIQENIDDLLESNDGYDSDDNLLAGCQRAIIQIQECLALDQVPHDAVQPSILNCDTPA